jgi:hypothetical protein
LVDFGWAYSFGFSAFAPDPNRSGLLVLINLIYDSFLKTGLQRVFFFEPVDNSKKERGKINSRKANKPVSNGRK